MREDRWHLCSAPPRRAPQTTAESLEPRRLLAVTATNLGVTVSELDQLVDVNGTLYFPARTPTGGDDLWRSDGTPQGTFRVTSGLIFHRNVTEVAGTVFFTARNPQTGKSGLYRTDGTPGAYSVVREFDAVDELVNANGTLFFVATEPASGRELWKSNGTPGTTVLVEDLDPGTGSSSLGELYAFGDQVFFYCATGENLGWELYKSDGTAAGTGLVKDMNPGEGNGGPAYFTEVGGKLFFSGQNSENNFEVWRTDGTAAGTTVVRDLPGDSGLTLRDKIAPGVALAITRTFDYPQELWRLDAATGNGTLTKVATIADTANGSGAFYFTDLGDGSSSVFTTNRTATGQEIWKTNGTAAGTVMIKDINPGAANGVDELTPMASAAGIAYFVGIQPPFDWELWRTDGTASGTYRVHDIAPGTQGSFPKQLTASGGKVFFTAKTSETAQRTLWVAAEPPPTGSIAGILYEDANGNGSRDAGERLLLNRVFLDTNNNALLDAWERTTLSSASGGYVFNNVPAGTYTVRSPVLSAWQATVPAEHVGRPVTLAEGQAVTGQDFGHRLLGLAALGVVSGTLFDDRNASGTRDTEERLLGGRTVFLDLDNDWSRDADEPFTTTDVAGTYAFYNLSPGRYFVRQVVPAGWAQTLPGNWASRSGVVTGGQIAAADFASRPDATPPPLPPHVAGRRLFFNNSNLDADTAGASALDDRAISTGTRALLPDGPSLAGAVNHSGYSKGVNGIMIDVASLPAAAVLTAADFTFRANTGAGWMNGPLPSSVTIRRGAGEGGTDRVTLIWAGTGANRAVLNGWLELTVLANADTGLTAPDTFLFGNMVGDSNGDRMVNSADFTTLASSFGRAVTPMSGGDFNGDGVINSADFTLLAGNFGRTLPAVQTTAAAMLASAAPVQRAKPRSGGRK